MKLFECSIRYEKTMENGAKKRVTEVYVVDALSFSEAERRLTEEMAPYVGGDMLITSIKWSNTDELVYDRFGLNTQADAEAQKLLGDNRNPNTATDRWYRAKVKLITLDERTMKERRTPMRLLVNAGTLNAAHDTLVSHMRGSVSDYEIEGIDETRIVDVFVYGADGTDGANGADEADEADE